MPTGTITASRYLVAFKAQVREIQQSKEGNVLTSQIHANDKGIMSQKECSKLLAECLLSQK